MELTTNIKAAMTAWNWKTQLLIIICNHFAKKSYPTWTSNRTPETINTSYIISFSRNFYKRDKTYISRLPFRFGIYIMQNYHEKFWDSPNERTWNDDQIDIIEHRVYDQYYNNAALKGRKSESACMQATIWRFTILL